MIFKDRFKDKVAVVTGGASGIARAIATRFVAEGGKVAIFDIQEALMAEVVAELGNENAIGLLCNTADKQQVKDATAKVVERFGTIDTLFNVAAIPCRNNFLDIEDEQFDECWSVNVKGYMNCAQVICGFMKDNGVHGSVVNFNSISTYLIDDYSVGYSITKGASWSMTRAMAIGLMPYGIRVNSVSPGFTKTPLTKHTWSNPEKAGPVIARIPLKRAAEPEEQAACALFLASDDASFVYGRDLICDGGIYVKN